MGGHKLMTEEIRGGRELVQHCSHHRSLLRQ
jgi:hypothetical protein